MHQSINQSIKQERQKRDVNPMDFKVADAHDADACAHCRMPTHSVNCNNAYSLKIINLPELVSYYANFLLNGYIGPSRTSSERENFSNIFEHFQNLNL